LFQHALNHAQQSALAQILSALSSREFSACLLFGVTGSGKTAVYLAALEQARLTGHSAILLRAGKSA